jgi:hypothetical protein
MLKRISFLFATIISLNVFAGADSSFSPQINSQQIELERSPYMTDPGQTTSYLCIAKTTTKIITCNKFFNPANYKDSISSPCKAISKNTSYLFESTSKLNGKTNEFCENNYLKIKDLNSQTCSTTIVSCR